MKDYKEEEQVLKDYTVEEDLDKIYEMNWSTAEVVDLMRLYKEKLLDNTFNKSSIEKLRDKFFNECVEYKFVGLGLGNTIVNKRPVRVSLAPHDLFEWFENNI